MDDRRAVDVTFLNFCTAFRTISCSICMSKVGLYVLNGFHQMSGKLYHWAQRTFNTLHKYCERNATGIHTGACSCEHFYQLLRGVCSQSRGAVCSWHEDEGGPADVLGDRSGIQRSRQGRGPAGNCFPEACFLIPDPEHVFRNLLCCLKQVQQFVLLVK